jgi:hypothetical protein
VIEAETDSTGGSYPRPGGGDERCRSIAVDDERVRMEAATAPGAGLQARDGALPTVPFDTRHDSDREAIDGVARCGCCGRFPLLGEQVVRHAGRSGGSWACEGCETGGRARRLGEVIGQARVRSLGGALNVRRLA